ncbi:MAG: prepilin-type N-terminal cleavage/methylation domain-containing protein, partial [Bdellovibrionota bacterium]
MNKRGFSLLELMVVVAIIALFTTMVIPSVSSYFQLSLNSAAREMASVIKEAYNSTIMTGRIHRLVFDLKEQTYWVESGPPTALLETKESKEREERKKKFFNSSDKPPPSSFDLEKSVTRKKIALP